MVLAGLGLGALPHERTLASLSGGQRGRLALAALLVRRPAALLLDEPTNHLDDAAAAFLEEQLRGLPGVVVVASHDRAFLDAVCTDLIDLDPAVDGPTRYGGNYTDYQAAKRAERERWQRRFAEEQEELAELRRCGRGDRARGGTGPRRSATTRRWATATPPGGYRTRSHGGCATPPAASTSWNASRSRKPPEPLRFRVTTLASTAAEGILVSLRDIRVPGRLTLDRLDVSATDRLLVTGPNGAGKSTLLAVLAGRLDGRR